MNTLILKPGATGGVGRTPPVWHIWPAEFRGSLSQKKSRSSPA
jgi:hypothetical protein